MSQIYISADSFWENELENQKKELYEAGINFKIVQTGKSLPANDGFIYYIQSPIALTDREIKTIFEQSFQLRKTVIWRACLNDIIFWSEPVVIYDQSTGVKDTLKILASQKRRLRVNEYIRNIYRSVRPMLPFQLEKYLLSMYNQRKLNQKERDISRHDTLTLPGTYLERLFCDNIKKIYPFPESFQLVITNRCSISCTMCPYHSERYRDLFKTDYFAHSVYMSEDIFRQIALEAGCRKSQLRFGNIEEPFMHPKLEYFAELAVEAGVPSMHISTNGTLFSKERLIRLLKAGVDDWQVSINGISEETYRKICGERFPYKKVVDNVRLLIELRSKYFSRANIRVSAIRGLLTDTELQQFVDFWRANGADQVTIYVLSDYEMGSEREAVQEYLVPTPKVDITKRRPCLSAWKEAYVLPKGEVGVCCNTVTYLSKVPIELLSLGQLVNDTTIEDIWLGEQFQRLRRSLIRNGPFTYAPCNGCTIWAAYNTKSEKTSQGDFVNINPWMKIITFSR